VSKFHNVITEVDGFKFASKKEARRYGELKLLQRAGKIRNLKVQPPFRLVVGEELVCKYLADFSYVDDAQTPAFVVEDVKSEITRKHPVYRIKNKLFKALMGFEITEV
jgi:hypothetical protein